MDVDDARALRSRGATPTPRSYGATPREDSDSEERRRRIRIGESFVLRRAVWLFAVAVVAALAAIAFQGTHARAMTSISAKFGQAADDVATDPTPEPIAVPEVEIQQTIPSDVKLSDDVPTARCACAATVTETIAIVFDSLPHDCAPLASMDKSCFSTPACDALKDSVNAACPGAIP